MEADEKRDGRGSGGNAQRCVIGNVRAEESQEERGSSKILPLFFVGSMELPDKI